MQTSRIVVGLKDRSLLNDTGISCVQRPRSLLPMALFWSRSPRCPRRFSFAACQNVREINGYSPVRALHRGRGYFPGKLPEFWRKHVDSSSQVTHSTARLRGRYLLKVRRLASRGAVYRPFLRLGAWSRCMSKNSHTCDFVCYRDRGRLRYLRFSLSARRSLTYRQHRRPTSFMKIRATSKYF
jgi:hypothetical protein